MPNVRKKNLNIVTFWIDQEIADKASELALREGRPGGRSDLLRDLLARYVEKHDRKPPSGALPVESATA